MSYFYQEKHEHQVKALEMLDSLYRQDETQRVESILQEAMLSPAMQSSIAQRASVLVEQVRKSRLKTNSLDAFMFQYDLSSQEGIALMCLAEALLRIPDKETRDKLIRDKLAMGDWAAHLGKSHSLFVNTATWALMLTGKMIEVPLQQENQEKTLTKVLKRLAAKGGEPIVREAIGGAMKILGRQFVMGRTIQEALKRALSKEEKGYCFSYDMLGEAAYTAEDAQKYFDAYVQAIKAVKVASHERGPIRGPGVSVKLSALHPRFVMAKRERVHAELLPRLKVLVKHAKEANIGLTVDAEEAHTLILNVEIIQAIVESDLLENWNGFGIAVQAYQKRAPALLDYLIDLLRRNKKKMMIRLVKGAYWDTEIKFAQVQGLSGYPVFTRKVATDVNYVACVKKMFNATDVFYPQFATHNALTLATVIELAQHYHVDEYEFQCLHGMGDALYDQIVAHKQRACRIYAPVGTHEELLAYLVRRLLENGANTSFVNRIADEKLPIEEMVASPIDKLRTLDYKPHPHIPLPEDLYAPYRPNAQGLDLSHPPAFIPVLNEIHSLRTKSYSAQPTVEDIQIRGGNTVECYSPISTQHHLGKVQLATPEIVKKTVDVAHAAFEKWSQINVSQRADGIEKVAILLEQRRNLFYSLLVYEAGKIIEDAVAEVREAIDFCYYYASEARKHFLTPQTLPGPTGEHNQLSLHGRGVMVCISPWNFPLAIFLGQVTAALAAGNCVIAKPAIQTNLIAQLAISLLHEAGFPKEVIQLLPGGGEEVGQLLVQDTRISGVLFTGSTATARKINQTLAARNGPIVPFIAETGGQNAMIVDSSALPEQVTQDVIMSAFRSAGQRCSALRVLFLQEEVADKMLTMIKGAMAEQTVGDPAQLSTDIGPVIDNTAKAQLMHHVEKMQKEGKLLYEMPLSQEASLGSFFAPRMYEIPSLDVLTHEVFGPILHVVKFKANQLDAIIEQINRTQFGLTMGIHSRVNETIEYIRAKVRVGNVYVNRNMIGAVVGVQPFGGEGLSGTGPKAGGPHYLLRLATERTLSVNTTASGGNVSLMSLAEENDKREITESAHAS